MFRDDDIVCDDLDTRFSIYALICLYFSVRYTHTKKHSYALCLFVTKGKVKEMEREFFFIEELIALYKITRTDCSQLSMV